mmetsp:Transcript_23032/g.32195  ORF Transcript_23032/g.32195 Transcript_23032/m.32195 type:complete len:85 (+) Transcript_23032:68-322(+)
MSKSGKSRNNIVKYSLAKHIGTLSCGGIKGGKPLVIKIYLNYSPAHVSQLFYHHFQCLFLRIPIKIWQNNIFTKIVFFPHLFLQ